MQEAIISIAAVLIFAYTYSRFVVHRHDNSNDKDDNKPPKCPNCGW